MRIKYALLIVVCCVALLMGTAAQADDYPPGIMYSTLLNGVVLNYNMGLFRLDNIQAVFLPEATSAGSIYPYNPDDGGKIWAILSTAGGQELYRFDFYGEKLKQPYWLLNSYKLTDLASGADISGQNLELKTVGDYVLDFYLPAGRFYTFDFSVSKLPPPDPFSGSDYYFLDGPWSDWGYFYYFDADPTRSIQFKVWLRNYAHATNKYVTPEIEVKRGGTLVATGRDMSFTPQQEWVRYEFDLIFPMEGTSGGAYFKAQDLLSTDGDYTLTLKLDGQLYGVWPFRVEGGKLNYTGRTLRGSADPLTFVEGGRDAWWYEKQ
ncbi:hypothetical protein JW859_06995 [bacterium]|nr:hypothetical protein [bacterium]